MNRAVPSAEGNRDPEIQSLCDSLWTEVAPPPYFYQVLRNLFECDLFESAYRIPCTMKSDGSPVGSMASTVCISRLVSFNRASQASPKQLRHIFLDAITNVKRQRLDGRRWIDRTRCDEYRPIDDKQLAIKSQYLDLSQ